jgi:glycerophosphoryl diester phosphodiesterase
VVSLAVTVEIIAHRGASADAPEHTLAAYDLALDQGADALEIDLRATADGKLVAVHDPTLERTHRDPRAVADLSFAELRALPERPERLGGLLRAYRGETRFLLELKDPVPPMERRVIRAVTHSRVRADVEVQSFDEGCLKRMRRLAPDIPLALLVDPLPARKRVWLDRALRLGARAVGIPRAQVDAELIDAAHERGLLLRAWTVNDPAEAGHLAGLGADALITDAPGAIRAALSAPRSLAA